MDRAKLKKRILMSIGGLVVISCTAVGVFAISLGVGMGGRRMEEEKARIREMGYPTSQAGYARKHPVDPENNAADAYRLLMKRKEDMKPLTDQLSKDGMGLGLRDPVNYTVLRKLDQDAAWVRKDIETITQFSQLDVSENWDVTAVDSFPLLASSKTFTKFICAHALVLAESGDRPAGIRYLTHAARLADQVGQGRDVISGLVQIADEANLHAAVYRLVLRGPLTAKDRAAFKDLSMSFGPALRYSDLLEREVIIVERRFLANPTERWQAVGLDADGPPSPKIPNWAPLREAILAGIWHSFRRQYEVTKNKESTYTQQTTALQGLEAELEKGNTLDAFVSSLVGVFTQAAMACGKMKVGRDMVQMLAEGSEEHPKMLDPCSDKPYIVRRDGNFLLVYSVNIDGKDDGGRFFREKDDHDSTHTTDIGLRIPLAK